ncbi:MAG: tRNA pseudouridine(38-40) synthase TruA [Christensenellales bacterium]
MRFKLTVEYDGTKYHGWQKQENALTVQETLEKALAKLGINATTTASGRTDSGVHAKGQVVHFDGDVKIPCESLPLAINSYLPSDVAVVKCEKAADDFNARFDAKRKTYCYRMYVSRLRHPLLENNHYHVTGNIDLEKMKSAAKVIEGEHDFKCFEASGSTVSDTVRTIYEIKIKTTELIDCREIEIYVTGNGFLYNMVRIIAGTLLYVGQGKLSVDDVKNILENKDRTAAGKTLSAKGLTLEEVVYE